jgi:3'(2'), 5'-bisphosphate nucleotidase
MPLFEEHLLKVSNLAISAGHKIMQHYNKDTKVMIKEDQSPLTNADLYSNNVICSGLSKIDSTIPIFSEELLIDWQIRKKWDKYWLIDPLDGTKEFINKNGEFTVNIALIENNKPVLGVIFAPVLSTLYFAFHNYGSYKLHCSSNLVSLNKSNKITVSQKKRSDHLLILGSRSHSNENFNKWVHDNIPDYELIKTGSSLKFCEIADGNADLYPRFGPTSEWDIAAGHIILNEAGGRIYSIDNKEIVYNKKENILNPYFIASGLMINE